VGSGIRLGSGHSATGAPSRRRRSTKTWDSPLRSRRSGRVDPSAPNLIFVYEESTANGFALAFDLGTLATSSPGTIDWAGSQEYDFGVTPQVAAFEGTVVEVHPDSALPATVAKLWYRVGHVDGSTMTWGDSSSYDDGTAPAIALAYTEEGIVAIEVHEGFSGDWSNPQGLWLRTGHVEGDTIYWTN
jgi:hypothetical protein